MSMNPDGLLLSQGYSDVMRDRLLPDIAARRHDELVPGRDDRLLFVSRFDADDPRGTVMIVHGFTENADKFSEVIHSLLQNHLSVVAYDQRGHGRSWRAPGTDDLSLTHVDSFDEYIWDLGAVCEKVLRNMPKPWRIFCHSMGGAVTALFLEGVASPFAEGPKAFDRIAMCAPMIAPSLSGVPEPLIRGLCAAKRAFGRGKQRIFMSKPYVYPDPFEPSCATGRERFAWYEALRKAQPLFTNNGPTYSWLLESVNVTRRILAPGAVERIEPRVQLYTASLDNTVLPGPQATFIRRVPRGEHFIVEGAKHEIYRSHDEVLFPWWHGVLGFLKGD